MGVINKLDVYFIKGLYALAGFLVSYGLIFKLFAEKYINNDIYLYFLVILGVITYLIADNLRITNKIRKIENKLGR